MPHALQELIYLVALFWSGWTEPASVIDEHHLSSLKMNDHVWLLITLDIDETERHRHQVSVSSIQLRAYVDASM